jgi:hypothetical protein
MLSGQTARATAIKTNAMNELNQMFLGMRFKAKFMIRTYARCKNVPCPPLSSHAPLSTLIHIYLTVNYDYISETIGCPTSGVAQRAMREAAPYARGVSKAKQL